MGLSLVGIHSYYGNVPVLRHVTLSVEAGQILGLLGRNGAGKTTLLRVIMGQVRFEGTIRLDGQPLNGLRPHQIPRRGIGYVPQGRRLFSELTVAENLEIGAMASRRGRPLQREMLTLFPRLEERCHQVAGTLSGGEQQMLAIARALCLNPSVLLLDEPTEGLMPAMVAGIREAVWTLRNRNVAVLWVEQRVNAVLPVADRVAFLENGVLQREIDRTTLDANPDLLRRYIGV